MPGELDIHELRRLWERKLASRLSHPNEAPNAEDLRCESLLLAAFKLGIRETLDFLMAALPSFEEFQQWILSKNGGAIDPIRLERLNAALRGDGAFTLESILAEPVLTPADMAFWDEHGYVVVKQAVTRDQCRAAVDAILEHTRMSLDQPDTWYQPGLWIPLAHHPALWANRDAPRIHTAFSQIWRRTDLWMNVDVCGVNPPLRPGYSFRGSPLHWDMTLTPPVRFGTQAILYLTDTAANQGAFSCVPGFHHQLAQWLRGLPEGADPRTLARQQLRAIPVAGDAGDLIIWHHALPHGATPNTAHSPRVVQYLNMFPSQYDINADWT